MREPSSESDRHPRFHWISLSLAILVFLSGGSLYYWRSNSVRLTADGKTRRIFTKAPSIKEFLVREKIGMGPYDFTTPPAESFIGPNTAVKITRVTKEEVVVISTTSAKIAWQTRTRQNLRRALVQKGSLAIVTSKIEITRHDGTEISRKTLTQKKSRKPFFQLILFNNSGQPAEKYNLLACKMLKMRATGYYVGEKYVPSDTTFLGHKLQRGLVAVDPTVIPLRTRLYVHGYGYSYASDTGSAIKGLRIDLAVKDKYEEARYNRHNVPVYLLEKSKTW